MTSDKTLQTRITELEAELQASVARFASFVDNTADLITQVDDQGNFTYVNHTAKRIFGIEPADCIGRSAFSFIHPDDQIHTMESFAQWVNQKHSQATFENRQVSVTGEIFHMLWTVNLFFDEAGQLNSVYSIARDITDRKRLEVERQQQQVTHERLLQGLAKATNLLLVSHDFETAVAQVLAILGAAVEVDRVYIFRNHQHPDTGDPLTSQWFEWIQEVVEPQINNPELQNLSYNDLFPRWYDQLTAGQPVVGFVEDFPATEREILEPQDIISILVMPIMIGDQCWGFIGFDHCQQTHQWTETELAVLNMAAGSIGGAISRHQTQQELSQAYDELEDRVAARTADLEKAQAEQTRLQQEIIEAQKQAIQELSVPIIPVMAGIIVMPLIGSIDSMRARDLMRTLLQGITQYRAKVVILDITGVPMVDSGIAAHLDKTIQAARLKGSRTIVTGISDAVAESIVDLGIDWSQVETLRDLQTGLVVALDSLGVKLYR